MGVARIFQRGGHTDSYRGYSSDCHLNIVSCLLTRRLTKGGGGGHRHPRTPLATPMNKMIDRLIDLSLQDQKGRKITNGRKFQKVRINLKIDYSNRISFKNQFVLWAKRDIIFGDLTETYTYLLYKHQ